MEKKEIKSKPSPISECPKSAGVTNWGIMIPKKVTKSLDKPIFGGQEQDFGQVKDRSFGISSYSFKLKTDETNP